MFSNSLVIHIQKMQQWIGIYNEKLKDAQTHYETASHGYVPIFDEYPIIINSIKQGQRRSLFFTVKSVKNALEVTQKRLETLQKMFRKEQINLEEYEFLKLSSPFDKDSSVLNYPQNLIKEDSAWHQHACCQI